MWIIKYTTNAGCKMKIEYDLHQINFAKKKNVYPSRQKM